MSDIAPSGKEQEGPSSFSIISAVTLYCVSGTLLTLVNKAAILVFHFPNLLLVIQNSITIVLLLAGSLLMPDTFGVLPPLTTSVVTRWLPLTLMFVVMLVTSLLALRHVSAVTLVVMRNLTTLVVAAADRMVLGTTFTTSSIVCLGGMLIGAFLYGASDLAFSLRGYIWLIINIVASSSYQIYVKKLVTDGLGPFGMSFYNNVISLPILCLLSLVSRELIEITKWDDLSVYSLSLILLSGLLGYALSTTAFLLNKLITATSIMVVNNTNKFVVILLSELFFERSLGPVATFGTAVVLFFAWMYGQVVKATAETISAVWRQPSVLVAAGILGLILAWLLGQNLFGTISPHQGVVPSMSPKINRTSIVPLQFDPAPDR